MSGLVGLFLGAGLLLSAGCVSTIQRSMFGISLTMSEPFAIVKSDKSAGWGTASHPYLCQLNSNRIMVTYWVAGDGFGKGTSQVDWPMYSDDKGRTWTTGDPMVWAASNPTRTITTTFKKGDPFSYNQGYCFGYCIQSNGMRVAQSASCSPVPGTSSQYYRVESVFSRDGLQWEGPIDVIYEVPTNFGLFFYPSSKAVQLADGSILVVGYTNPGKELRAVSMVFRSVDGGLHYDYWSTVGSPSDAPWGSASPCEPGIELLTNGALVCVMRTGDSSAYSEKGGNVTKMLQSTSEDGGLTWEKRFFNRPGVMPKLLQMKNGLLVCAFGRPGNNMVFSKDGGRSWGAETEITPADLRSSGYLDMLEVEPGRLLVVYDAYNYTPAKFWLWEPPEEMNALYGRYVDVEWTQ